MKIKNKALIIVLTIIFVVFTVGCKNTMKSDSISTTSAKDSQIITLTISAAASMTETMEEIKKLYASEKSNVTIVYNFGSSGSLQQQIEQGAEVDIFLSAATKQMDALGQKDLIAKDTRINLVENKVVLITSKDAGISDFKDAAGDKVKTIALGEPKSVPAGQYAEEVFTKLSILDKVKPKAVYAKDVKEVLTWVESGNADAGVVYETDAKASSKVKVAAQAPTGSNAPILYPAAVIKASKNADEAKEFMKFLKSDKSQEVYKKYGFVFVGK